jgi:hypothetical protein
MVLEYRYLLIVYIILLYFALRINIVKELIENEFRILVFVYGLLISLGIIYFIEKIPVGFMDIYYYISQLIWISLLLVVSLIILLQKKKHLSILLNTICLFIITLSIAQASFLMFFYYLIVSMTYISPSQNFAILPIAGIMIKWMYQIFL